MGRKILNPFLGEVVEGILYWRRLGRLAQFSQGRVQRVEGELSVVQCTYTMIEVAKGMLYCLTCTNKKENKIFLKHK